METRNDDIKIYGRFNRVNSDSHGNYIVNAEQVEDWAKNYYQSSFGNNKILVRNELPKVTTAGNIGDIWIAIE